jgi:hypothetical protein
MVALVQAEVKVVVVTIVAVAVAVPVMAVVVVLHLLPPEEQVELEAYPVAQGRQVLLVRELE